MPILLAAAYFTRDEEEEMGLILHAPQIDVSRILCITEGRDALRELLEEGHIDKTNHDYLRDELDRSALPYSTDDIPSGVRLRIAEDDIGDLLEAVNQIHDSMSEFPIEGRPASEQTDDEEEGQGEQRKDPKILN